MIRENIKISAKERLDSRLFWNEEA
jgi:hypothetical protein